MIFAKRFVKMVAGAGVFAVGSAGFLGAAAYAAPGAKSSPDDPVVKVESYAAKDFAAEAKALPSGMKAAVERDLNMSVAEYLADAEAAKNASDVAEALEDGGVAVVGTELSDDGVVIRVKSKKDVAAVKATGATAIVGAKKETKPKFDVPEVPLPSKPGGLAVLSDQSGCSLGFNGYDKSGNPVNLMTGHCVHGANETLTYFQRESPFITKYNAAGEKDYGVPRETVGQWAPGTTRFDDGSDADSVLMKYSSEESAQPNVSTWGGGEGADTDGTLNVLGAARAVIGAPSCKSGASSGWTCGTVLRTEELVPSAGDTRSHNVITSTCIISGDSGGATLMGNYALGVNASTRYRTPWSDDAQYFPKGEHACDREAQAVETADNIIANGGAEGWSRSALIDEITRNIDDYVYSGVFAVDSGSISARSLYGDGFQLSVVMSDPVVSSPKGSVLSSTAVSGTLANATSDHKVKVSVDGGAASSVAVGTGGAWSLSLSGLSEGEHTYSVQAVYGAGEFSKSKVVTGSFEVVDLDPVVVSSPKSGQVVSDAREPFVGSAEPGSQVTLTVSGNKVGTATAGADGAFRVVPTKDLPVGRFSASVSEYVAAHDLTASASVKNLGRAPAAPGVLVKSGSTVKPGGVISGTGVPGAKVTVKLTGPSTVTLTATVGANGKWSVTLPKDLAAGTYKVSVTQSVGGLASASVTLDELKVPNKAGKIPDNKGKLAQTGSTATMPLIIGLALVLLGGMAVGAVQLRKRRLGESAE